MELHSHEGEIPIPLNTAYGGGGGHGHMIHHDHHHHHPHNHIIPSSSPHPQIQIPSTNTNNNNNVSSTSPSPVVPTSINLELDQNNVPYKKMVRYRECLKNHAASMGGNATDGCGEFMPSGEEGSIEALTCSACNCHRNFHRKEVEGEPNSNSSPCDCLYPQHQSFNRVSGGGGGRKMILGGHPKGILATPEAFGYPTSGGGTLIPSRPMAVPHHQMVLPYNIGGSLHSESDEQEEGNNGGVVLMGNISSSRPPLQQMVMMKKRFRTKFTQEQKEKMLNFAEKVGWKIQKQEEAVVQQFCQEIGVKRRVLKVWMHNNKHNLAKKIDPSSTTSA